MVLAAGGLAPSSFVQPLNAKKLCSAIKCFVVLNCCKNIYYPGLYTTFILNFSRHSSQFYIAFPIPYQHHSRKQQSKHFPVINNRIIYNVAADPIGGQSIVIIMSVCLSVCLSVSTCIYQKPHVQILPIFVFVTLLPWLCFLLTLMQYVMYFWFCG